jgi:hypothetical protein
VILRFHVRAFVCARLRTPSSLAAYLLAPFSLVTEHMAVSCMQSTTLLSMLLTPSAASIKSCKELLGRARSCRGARGWLWAVFEPSLLHLNQCGS